MRALALLGLLALPSFAQVTETITVERILIDARVTDSLGHPVLGLTRDDFRVSIDGKVTEIVSVDWIPESSAARTLAGIEEKTPQSVDDASTPGGRLLIYFFQTDFAREPSRVKGQLQLVKRAGEFVDWLDPEDRVAVFSFDSHLKFRLDFTNEKRDILQAMESSLLIDDPSPPRAAPMPSMARGLDREEMRRAATSEEALILVANALRRIQGPKSLVLFGWGLGEFGPRGVTMTHDYEIARRALESARVTIFALDMTIADYHSLELGLKTAAADTGGFYAKTDNFPRIAIERLQRTLSGHYELEVRKPATRAGGEHTIDVRVKRRGVTVLARNSYVDE